jgi:hypothetical protein
MVEACTPQLLVKVEGDLAIGMRPKAMLLGFQIVANAVEIVKLAVHHDTLSLIFRGDWLLAERVDNTQPRMPEPNASIWREPDAVSVRPPVPERERCPLQRRGRNRSTAGKYGYDAAHLGTSVEQCGTWNYAGGRWSRRALLVVSC